MVRTLTQVADNPLPSGLTIRKRGEYIETVFSKAAEIRLLVAGHGMEVLEGTLEKGQRLTLVPSADPAFEATEAYYILEGRLRCDLYGVPIELGAGDHITAQSLGEPALFSVEADVRFLYFTTQPAFHEISGGLSDLRRLAVEVELKDGYTADHCARLQSLSYATGRRLGLSAQRLHLLDIGSYLHDVGKIRVPAEILQKPAALTAKERAVINRHPSFGRALLEETYMRAAGAIVEQHHERLDGSGYPFGLAGDEILTEAYVVAVADTFDAMTTDRPYRRALSSRASFAELWRFAGVHYPPAVVAAFVEAVGESDPGAAPLVAG